MVGDREIQYAYERGYEHGHRDGENSYAADLSAFIDERLGLDLNDMLDDESYFDFLARRFGELNR